MRPFSSATMGVAGPIGTGIGSMPAHTEKLTIAAGYVCPPNPFWENSWGS